MTFVSPFIAYICWYAKGKGITATAISSIIFMFISRQTFAFGFWYFDIRNILELLLWLAMIFVLYQSPKQIIKVATIGLLFYFLTAQINLFWGMLQVSIYTLLVLCVAGQLIILKVPVCQKCKYDKLNKRTKMLLQQGASSFFACAFFYANISVCLSVWYTNLM